MEKVEMSKVSYASVVGSLMYAMVCTRPDIRHTVGVVIRIMSALGCCEVNILVLERHPECVSPIWLK